MLKLGGIEYLYAFIISRLEPFQVYFLNLKCFLFKPEVCITWLMIIMFFIGTEQIFNNCSDRSMEV